MLSVARRRNPLLVSLPYIISRRGFGFRTIWNGCPEYAPSISPSPSAPPSDYEAPVPGTKVLETFTEQFEIGSREITLETGKIARFANGAVVLAMEETKILSTIASAKGDTVRDFLPLTVCSLFPYALCSVTRTRCTCLCSEYFNLMRIFCPFCFRYAISFTSMFLMICIDPMFGMSI